MRIQILIFCLVLLSGPLFGQEVLVISPSLDSFLNIRDFTISSTEDEAFFTVQSPNQELSQLVVVRDMDWDNPVLLPFCDAYSYMEPFLSKDGNRLYFASNRPKSDLDSGTSDFDIWYVERKDKDGKWSEPINVGNQVNSENDEFYPSISDNGNLYFTMDAESGLGKDDIYYCIWDGKGYSSPILLNSAVNSEGYEFNAFIAKDESFLIYTKYNAAGGLGSGDLYISKKDQHGEWLPAENMGDKINTRYMEYCPFYDSYTHTLYFTSRRASLIPEKYKDLKEYLGKINSGENGLSKLYKVKIEI